jgi:hypothetical protein
MADSNRIPMIIALIGLAGSILAGSGVALFNYFKPPPTASAPSLTPGPSAETVAAAEKLSRESTRGYDEAASMMGGIADQIAGANLSQIGGRWVADGGYAFEFNQSGSSYTFRQFKNGTPDGGGSGALTRRKFAHSFASGDGTTGRCTGEVASDGLSAAGDCVSDSGGRWNFRVTRP